MKLFPGNWTGFLDDLGAWGSLSIAARRTFLDGVTPGLGIDPGRGDPAIDELRDEGMLAEPDRPGPIEVGGRFVTFHQVLKSLQKFPLFESPGLAVLCGYVAEHYTPPERSQLHESLALLPNDLARIAGLVSSVEWLQTGLSRQARGAGDAGADGRVAKRMLDFFTQQRDRIPLREVEEYFPGMPREELCAGIRRGLQRMVFLLALRRTDLEPIIGIWPPAARRLRRLSVILAPEPAPAERTFRHPFLAEDMTTILRLAFAEPIPLRRGDEKPFARFVEETGGMLLTLPDWIEGVTGLNPEARIDLALQALRLTGLLHHGTVTSAGREWVRRGLAGRLAFLLDALTGGALFSLLEEEAVPADGGRDAIAPWVVQAFSSVPQTTTIRFSDFAEYQAAIGTPLIVSEEAAEELWKSFLALFLGRCLLSLGGAEAGAAADGRLVFRLTADGCRLLGLPWEGREDQPASPPAGTLIVSPNYEVVFLATDPGREAELGRFCERAGRGVGVLFRIERRAVQRAAASGMGAAEVISTLEAGSKGPVPSNVAHEIEAWMGGAPS